MALKALLLRKRLDAKQKELETLRAKTPGFVTREAELTQAIDETETDEQRSEVETMITEFEAERDAHTEAVTALEREIGEIETELAAEEAAQNTTPPEPASEPAPAERTRTETMSTRNIFSNMGMAERDAFFAREDVKSYISEVRSCIKEKRALTNVGLTIPPIMLGLLRQNIENYSKLYKHVTVRPIGGEGRQVIMGSIPEAIWTDCCANLNELNLSFNDFELDCYKVGGYFSVCNANLEDSDIDLASELLTALGQAIGIALDKAILYGRNADGTMKMPLGVMSRLAQTEQPAGYPATARAWADLHSTNVKTLANSLHGKDLFAQILIGAGAAKGKYSSGQKTWVMNETTYTFLMAEAVSIDANGAIVSGVNGTMPVIGGSIEILDFVPDYVIVGGYFDLYLLGERAGQKFASSEHVRFLADQTVFKGTARYDGGPVIAEAFVAIGVNGVTPGKVMTFASDEANGVKAIAINTATATVPVDGSIQLYAMTTPGDADVFWTSATTGKATVNSSTGVVTGVASGTSVITATCNGLTASCTVTVTTA